MLSAMHLSQLSHDSVDLKVDYAMAENMLILPPTDMFYPKKNYTSKTKLQPIHILGNTTANTTDRMS